MERDKKTVILKPITAKLKSKIRQAGNEWIVIRESDRVPCLNGPGLLVTPVAEEYEMFTRWVPPEAIQQ